MKNDEVARHLRDGDIEVVGKIAASSNQALLVDVTHGGSRLSACYKTELGERPLWDFPEGLWRREVAAWRLADAIGLDLIPVTVERNDGPYGPGSLQLWVATATDDHYFTVRDREELQPWFMALAAFDVIANNTDRKSGHVLFDGSRCWGIDQGLCFGDDSQLRTVIWDFAGMPLPTHVIEALTRATAVSNDLFADLLTVREINAIRQRATELLSDNRFPVPNDDGEWPPYPWPLI